MSMPQRGEPGQPWEAGPQAYPQDSGYPQGQAYGSASGEGYGGPGGQGQMQGRPISPVNEIDTRVSGRRTVQYIVDAIIFGIVASVISWALSRGHGGVHALLTIILIVLDVIWYTIYWAMIPTGMNGQTLGMRLMSIRVISADGGPASFMQMFVRSILLVLFSPISVIVGIITMMVGRYRQRVGDHIAKTMVVRSEVEPVSAQREFAGAGQAGSR